MPIPGQAEFPPENIPTKPLGPAPAPLGMAPAKAAMRFIDSDDGEGSPADGAEVDDGSSIAGLLVGGLAIGVSALILFGTMRGVK